MVKRPRVNTFTGSRQRAHVGELIHLQAIVHVKELNSMCIKLCIHIAIQKFGHKDVFFFHFHDHLNCRLSLSDNYEGTHICII